MGDELVELACHAADRQVLMSNDKDLLQRVAEEDTNVLTVRQRRTLSIKQHSPPTVRRVPLKKGNFSIKHLPACVFILFIRLQRRWRSNQLPYIRCQCAARLPPLTTSTFCSFALKTSTVANMQGLEGQEVPAVQGNALTAMTLSATIMLTWFSRHRCPSHGSTGSRLGGSPP